jgi:hypothetical protein
MRNRAEEIRAQLEAEWPGWQVWIVWRAVGGQTWCARRWDGTGQVLNANSAGHLAECLEEETAR